MTPRTSSTEAVDSRTKEIAPLSDDDRAQLRSLLDGRWAAVREDVREQLAGVKFEPSYDLDTPTYRRAVLDQMHKLADSGRPRLGFATEYGGENDIGGSVTSFEMIGFTDLSLLVKAGVHWGLFGGAVQVLGTERHHRRYLRSIIDFTLPGCFAMTETGRGSDVQSLRTRATYDEKTHEFVLHTPDLDARKDYIGNAAEDGKMAVVFARLETLGVDYGVHAFLVPIRTDDHQSSPGVEISDCGHKIGLNGVDNGRLSFDDVRIPREALLNRFADVAEDGTYTTSIENDTRRFFTMLGTLIRGRVSIAGGAGSATKSALTIALRYGQKRRQFSQPGVDGDIVILDYLAHQRKLIPALATTYALHFAQGELVSTLHDVQTDPNVDERRQRELETRTAGIKAVATWHATATIQACREACGGAGYLSENLLGTLKADTDVFTTFEGDNTVLLQLAAKSLLTNYRDHVGDFDAWDMARFVADQFVGTAIERTAARSLIQRLVDAAPGRGDDANLLDRGWQLKTFEYREKHVLDSLARRLRRAGDGKHDPFTVFNSAQDHLLKAARVHVDRIVLEAFVAGLDRCTSPAATRLLSEVCDLYALANIEADRAWFMEHGWLTSNRSKAVIQAVNTRCRRLRPHVDTLIDGFAIPDAWLAAPIA